MTMLSGLPGNFTPYRPSPRGGGASAIGITRRASAAWRISTRTESPVAPTPPGRRRPGHGNPPRGAGRRAHQHKDEKPRPPHPAAGAPPAAGPDAAPPDDPSHGSKVNPPVRHFAGYERRLWRRRVTL